MARFQMMMVYSALYNIGSFTGLQVDVDTDKHLYPHRYELKVSA